MPNDDDCCPGPVNVVCLICWGIVEHRCPCKIRRHCKCVQPKIWDETAELKKRLERHPAPSWSPANLWRR